MSSPCLICKLKRELCLLDSVRERERGGVVFGVEKECLLCQRKRQWREGRIESGWLAGIGGIAAGGT